MILGGVILPINGLFSTILSSTGMSKEYLKLEVIRKICFSVPIIIFVVSKSLEIYLYSYLLVGGLLIIFSIFYMKIYKQIKMILFLNPFFKSLSVFLITIFLTKQFLVFNFDYKIINITYKFICFFVIYCLFSYMLKLGGVTLIANKMKSIKFKKNI